MKHSLRNYLMITPVIILRIIPGIIYLLLGIIRDMFESYLDFLDRNGIVLDEKDED